MKIIHRTQEGAFIRRPVVVLGDNRPRPLTAVLIVVLALVLLGIAGW